jgi:dUTP pyrophosphatase
MKVKVKRLSEQAILPTKAYEHDAGFDLYAIETSFESGTDFPSYPVCVTYKTGISVEIPVGYAGFIMPRSSIFKTRMTLANSVGVIDSGYRGEIMVKMYIPNEHSLNRGIRYFNGERVAQLIIMPVPDIELVEVDELEASERGERGFGSSDSKHNADNVPAHHKAG